jgi:uncharacterized membrane protein
MRTSLLSLLLVAPALGCGSNDSASTPATSSSSTTPPPTFTNVYATVLSQRCAVCHADAGAIGVTQGTLALGGQSVAYASLVGVAASGSACAGHGTRVVPGQPSASLLYLKISLDSPAPCGAKMPFEEPSLTRAETDLVAAWITAGARDD